MGWKSEIFEKELEDISQKVE